MQRWAQRRINNHTFEAQGKIKNPSYAPFSDRPEEKGISSPCSSWYICASDYCKSNSLNSMYYICYWWEIFEDVTFIIWLFWRGKNLRIQTNFRLHILRRGTFTKRPSDFKMGMMVLVSLTYHLLRALQSCLCSSSEHMTSQSRSQGCVSDQKQLFLSW